MGNPQVAHTTGVRGERIAERLLVERGCAIIARNVRADGGEIDLIIRDGTQTAAVEVKTTTDGTDPADAVDDRKVSIVARTASSVGYPIGRIDVVTVRIMPVWAEVRWLRGVD